jgi:hypothetical protein
MGSECNRNCTLGRTEFDEIDNLSRTSPVTLPLVGKTD